MAAAAKRNPVREFLPRTIISDIASIVAAYVVAFLVRGIWLPGQLETQYALLISLLGAIVWLIALTASGAYTHTAVRSGVLDAASAVKATAFAFLLMAAFSYVLNAQFSRALVLVSFPVGLLFIVAGRRMLRAYMQHRLEAANAIPRAVVISRVGASPAIDDVINSNPGVTMRVSERLELHRDDLVHAGLVDVIIEAARRNGAHSVVLDSSLDLTGATISEISWQLDQMGIDLLAAPSFLGSWSGRLLLERHPSLPLVALAEPRMSPLQEVQKRLLDVIFAVPTFIALIPVYIVIGLLVSVTSPGPILFVQERIGVDGRKFRFLKFRTMVEGAHLQRLDVLGRPDEDMVERYKNDPRVTRVGRVLRRFSLDELPQIWHVITGEMSIVGPRPMLEEELEQLESAHERRRLFKPGLTGLWQISGRKETTFDERMQIDLRYIDEWTVGLDLVIIARTFGVVLSGKGSY